MSTDTVSTVPASAPAPAHTPSPSGGEHRREPRRDSRREPRRDRRPEATEDGPAMLEKVVFVNRCAKRYERQHRHRLRKS